MGRQPRLTDTGKNGYDAEREFAERTKLALALEPEDTEPLARSKTLCGRKRFWAYDALMTLDALQSYMQVAYLIVPLRRFRVLDLGCGYGKMAGFFTMLDCSEYVGIDPTEERIAMARRRHGGPRVRFEVADGRDYRPEEPFDLVWCCAVIHHLVRPDKLAVLRTIRAALKPGGFALLKEGKILRDEDPEEHYADAKCASHMIPISFEEVADSLKPCTIRQLQTETEPFYLVEKPWTP